MSETLNFTKLADAPMLETVPDGATAYAEVDGKVYRVPGDSLGGGGGIKTAIVQLNMVQETSSGSSTQVNGTCQNMTFDEAKAILLDGQPLAIILVVDLVSDVSLEDAMPASWYADGCTYSASPGYIVIQVTFVSKCFVLKWTPDGSIAGAF